VAVPLAGFVVFMATMTTVAIGGAGYCHHYSKREKEFFHRHLVIVKLLFNPSADMRGQSWSSLLQCPDNSEGK
jgi:hypothetical protein